MFLERSSQLHALPISSFRMRRSFQNLFDSSAYPYIRLKLTHRQEPSKTTPKYMYVHIKRKAISNK